MSDHPSQEGDRYSVRLGDAPNWRPWAAGVTAAVLAAPFLIVLFYIAAAVVYFRAGGTLISDGVDPPHAVWEKPAYALLGAIALWSDFWIGRRFYRRSVRKNHL